MNSDEQDLITDYEAEAKAASWRAEAKWREGQSNKNPDDIDPVTRWTVNFICAGFTVVIGLLILALLIWCDEVRHNSNLTIIRGVLWGIILKPAATSFWFMLHRLW